MGLQQLQTKTKGKKKIQNLKDDTDDIGQEDADDNEQEDAVIGSSMSFKSKFMVLSDDENNENEPVVDSEDDDNENEDGQKPKPQQTLQQSSKQKDTKKKNVGKKKIKKIGWSTARRRY